MGLQYAEESMMICFDIIPERDGQPENKQVAFNSHQ